MLSLFRVRLKSIYGWFRFDRGLIQGGLGSGCG
jgi:hypothetical protein